MFVIFQRDESGGNFYTREWTNGTHRTLASVCRRFFRYRLWYFCKSPIEPCSACILLADGETLVVLLLLDSKSLAVLLLLLAFVLVVLAMIDFTLDLILMRLILIFGEGVNERTTSAYRIVQALMRDGSRGLWKCCIPISNSSSSSSSMWGNLSCPDWEWWSCWSWFKACAAASESDSCCCWLLLVLLLLLLAVILLFAACWSILCWYSSVVLAVKASSSVA